MIEKGKKHTIKLDVDESLYERLTYFTRRTGKSDVDVITRILEQHLPNMLAEVILTIKRLTEAEQQILKQSFYTIIFLVSYADGHYSVKEKFAVANEFIKLKKYFGQQFIQFVDLPKNEMDELLKRIKGISIQDAIKMLLDLRAVFEKLPEVLMEEYKMALLGAAIEVAQASKEKIFSEERVSDEERDMIRTIMVLLTVSVEHHSSFFDSLWLETYRIQLWKEKQEKQLPELPTHYKRQREQALKKPSLENRIASLKTDLAKTKV